MENDLFTLWQDIADRRKIAPEMAARLFADVITRYKEPHRAYHNLQHLQEIFEKFEWIKDKLGDADAVALALFYHDIIYDPRRADNEAKSAAYAARHLQAAGLHAAFIGKIQKMILATKDHTVRTGDDDLVYMLDIDMSILAAPAERYAQYLQQVRQEYAHLDDAAFYAARCDRFLRPTLKAPIFKTRFFKEKYQAAAQANLTRELSEISKFCGQ